MGSCLCITSFKDKTNINHKGNIKVIFPRLIFSFPMTRLNIKEIFKDLNV